MYCTGGQGNTKSSVAQKLPSFLQNFGYLHKRKLFIMSLNFRSISDTTTEKR